MLAARALMITSMAFIGAIVVLEADILVVVGLECNTIILASFSPDLVPTHIHFVFREFGSVRSGLEFLVCGQIVAC